MSKKPYVLVVEDDEWMARQHVRALASGGIQADYVGHALAAMEALDAHVPDVIVLDVLLPGPNAFTMLHELRSHVDLAVIPIVLCTNSADSLAKNDLSAYGVRAILDKTTMRPGDLVAAIKKVL